MDDKDIIDLIEKGEYGKAWHALGEKTHKKGGAHTNDDGTGGPTSPPPPPPEIKP